METVEIPITDAVDQEAIAWVKANYRDSIGRRTWQNRFTDTDMETAYGAGFAAGLGHACKVMKGA